MWLLNTANLKLKEFNGNIPPYAILSHVWSLCDEITFTDMRNHRDTVKNKSGFSKISGCCEQALRDGYEWAWIDSCCIAKRNSAELSEAINSMFQWYGKAKRCYVYLADVNSGAHALQELKKSRWFTRGWTLQELVAPANIVFFARDWTAIGETQRYQKPRSVHDIWYDHHFAAADGEFSFPDLTIQISRITHIPRDILTGRKSISQTCVAQRMYWASRRLTTRPEDRAYSLMGLFNISMPILYGEGLEMAFDRLQREIMSKTPDQSIFAWYRPDAFSYRLLAESPDHFRHSGSVVTLSESRHAPFNMTNIGLRITLPVATVNKPTLCQGDTAHAVMNCAVDKDGVQQRLTLSLEFLHQDPDGIHLVLCTRPCRWTFLDARATETLQSMYIVPKFNPEEIDTAGEADNTDGWVLL